MMSIDIESQILELSTVPNSIQVRGQRISSSIQTQKKKKENWSFLTELTNKKLSLLFAKHISSSMMAPHVVCDAAEELSCDHKHV